MYKYLIVYEVFPRELESILLLKLELEKRGHEVCIERRPYTDIHVLRKKYHGKVDAVLLPTLYSQDAIYSVYYIIGTAARIVNLQWEQVSTFSGEAETTGGRSMYPQGLCREAVELCWGEKPRDNLIRAGVEPEKCIVTGPIHMDFLRGEFCDYYLKRNELFKEFKLDPNKRTLLFISSFSLTAPPEKLRQYLVDIEGEEYIDEWSRFSLRSQEMILDWFDRLLTNHSDIVLIYRPHPTEFDSIYLSELKEKHSNFKVISEYSVKQWIITVDKVFVWYSTSSAEIFFSNIPFSILRPIPVSYDRELTILKDAFMIQDEKTLEKSLFEVGNMPLDEKIIKIYYDVTTKMSYIRVCDALEYIVENPEFIFRWRGDTYVQFRKRCAHEYIKRSLMPIYIRLLECVERFNNRTGSTLLTSRVNNYRDSQQNTDLVFNKDASFWEERIHEIMKKLRHIVMHE